jgi:iron(III) transport system substrate-binding protein
MKKITALLLVLVMALGLSVGCARQEVNTQPDPTEAPAATEAPVAEVTPEVVASAEPEKPELSGTMKVVATGDVYGPLFEEFTKDTGVTVEVLSMSSGEVLSKLRAEGGTPSADLWFGGGIDAFMSAADDGLLEELKLDKPTSWDDLTKEEYKGEIVMSNPAVSGTNYAVVNALLQAKGDAGWDYFEKLNENIAYYGRRGSDPKNKVTADEFAIGITYVDPSIEKLTEDYNVSVIYPSDGIPWVSEGVAAFKNAENVEAAKAFIEWLFSNDDHLRQLASIENKTGVKIIKPSIEGVELTYDASILMDEDLSLFGKQREEILARFEPMMGDKAAQE